MVAPTGARRTKADHPALPITLAEILETAAACHQAGADALHLHVRDAAGLHTLDAGRYREALDELHNILPGFPVQITTEAAGLFNVQAQLDCLKSVKPKWASISVREIDRSPERAGAVYGACADNGTVVQHILYGPQDAALLAQRQMQGIIRPDQNDVIFVLGRYSANQTSDPRDLQPFLTAAHGRANWMVCAFGSQEHRCLKDAARRGGALRVGFENNLTDGDGRPFADNAASVAALRSALDAARP